MSKINDGGPAFPHLGTYMGADGNIHPTPTQYEGMTLRDYFAAKAMQGLLSAYGVHAKKNDKGELMITTTLAKCAFELADEMLAAREKGKA